MDEMLSMSLWIIIAFFSISAAITWFGQQTDFPTFMGLTGVTNTNPIDANNYSTVSCTMTTLVDFPGYAICFLNQLITPIFDLIGSIWGLFFNWQNLFIAIFTDIPAGGLFIAIFLPFLTIIEVAASIVILMRLAAIIRGVAGGFL